MMTGTDIKDLASKLKGLSLAREVPIMEVCGTHTTEFFRTGVKDLFPPGLRLIDGPGCPVCVTPNSYLDLAMEIAKTHGVVIATFGDMVKVPSSYSSLAMEMAGGMPVEVVYSPLDAVELADKHPDREFMFLSIGFETTAPTEAVALQVARRRNIKNFSILPGNKLTPPAVRAVLDAGVVNIDGFILPGHVSAVIGVDGWRFLASDYGMPCVVAGFEAHDLVRGTLILLDLITAGRTEIINEYTRVVKERGNLRAQEVMLEVFQVAESEWRGLGTIPASGLALRKEYAGFDASVRFPASPPPPKEHAGCRCGDLLRGVIIPPECPLFGTACTPARPVGPCMVSAEGPCSAYFKYGRD